MYRVTTNQSGDLSENIFCQDIIRKGWMYCTPNSRDSVYDYIVDLGKAGLVKVQVKTMDHPHNRQFGRISKRMSRSGQSVSVNGKKRNYVDYAEEGIDWLVGVDRFADDKCYYYSHSTYSKILSDSFSVGKYPSEEFPVNEDVPTQFASSVCHDQLNKEEEVSSNSLIFLDS